MKNKVATLEVYIDNDPSPENVSGIAQTSPDTWVLTMYPNQKATPAKTQAEFQTIMAHELGHFVAMVTHDQTHYSNAAIAGKTLFHDSPTLALPGERKAWQIAHDIYPNLLASSEKSCLDSYENAAKAEFNIMAGILKRMQGGNYNPLKPLKLKCFAEPDEDAEGRWENEGGYPQWFSNLGREPYEIIAPSWYWMSAFIVLVLLGAVCGLAEILYGVSLQ